MDLPVMISCSACGERISHAAAACPKCGHPVSALDRKAAIGSTYTQQNVVGHAFGAVSMVIGIVGLLTCWVPYFGLFMNVIALASAVVATAIGKKKGMALAGFILSILGFAGYFATMMLKEVQ